MVKKSRPTLRKTLMLGAAFLVFLVIVIAAYGSYLFFSSPSSIRNPYLQHYHFRLQILVDGRPVNFAEQKYQTAETNLNCNLALPATPVHFHDKKNQIVHVHWDGLSGGLVLKDYGWNYIGGSNGILGYRFDNLPRVKKVPIHGWALPPVPSGDNFYVYSGDPQTYKERRFNDFLNQDLEVFFGRRSNLPSSKPHIGLIRWLAPRAYAQAPHLDEAQLTQLNNLIGNAVIFVQKNQPTVAQVKDRFDHLEPLSTSVCGS